MLGDSHIWGTEQTAPDGLICDWPHGNRKGFSNLPSETTFPYFLDDWKEVVNLAWPGFGVDFVVDRFIHKVFDILEPDDNIVIFMPTGTRKLYAKSSVSDIFNQIRHKDFFEENPLEDHIFRAEVFEKYNSTWPEICYDDIVYEYKKNNGFTDNDDEAFEEFLSFNETQRMKWIMDSILFMNLTFNNSANQIFNALNAIVTIDKLAKSKGCPNVFFVIDTSAIDTNTQNITIRNMKYALGKKISERILCTDWSVKMHSFYFHKSKIKDKERWVHPEGHFTNTAHEFFARQIKVQFDLRRKDNE